MKTNYLFWLFVGLAFLIVNPTYGDTIYVPDDYSTIQEAVDAAFDGDTILVGPGTYSGQIRIHDKNDLTLIGAGVGSSILIDDSDDGYAISVAYGIGDPPRYIDIEGFTIIAGYQGIRLGSAEGDFDASIRNCEIFAGRTGIYFGLQPGIVHIENNIISNNYSESQYGSGIDTPVSNPLGHVFIQNNTVVNCNKGIWIRGSISGTLTMKNNIIASNIVGVNIMGLNNRYISHNNTWNNTENDYEEWDQTAGEYIPFSPDPGTGEISANPRFVSENDFHISFDSPCIDAGTYVGIFDDIDDEARPMWSGFDIGADEYSGPIWPRVDLYPIPKWRPIIPNLRSSRGLPITILTTDIFDASEVDPFSCEISGSPPLRWKMKDVDKDGDLDMLVFFKIKDLELNEDVTEVILEGETYNGDNFFGLLPVNIVSKGNAYGKIGR